MERLFKCNLNFVRLLFLDQISILLQVHGFMGDKGTASSLFYWYSIEYIT